MVTFANTFDSLWNAVKANPSPVLAAVIGGFLALVGVFIGFAWNLKKHSDDRKLALKKDIYLSLAESVAVLRMQFGASLLRESDNSSFIGAMEKFEGAVGKVRTVADVQTIKGLIPVQDAVLSAVDSFYRARGEWLAVSERRSQVSNEVSSLSNRIAVLSGEGLKAPIEMMAGFANELDSVTRAWNAARREAADLEDLATEHFAKLAAAAFDAQAMIGNAHARVILLTRQELNIKGQENVLLELFGGFSEKQAAAVSKSIEALRALQQKQRQIRDGVAAKEQESAPQN